MKITKLFHKAKAAYAGNAVAKADADRRAAGAMALVAVGAFAVMPELAMAAPWDSAASSVLAIFTGGLSRTLAIIAVVALGISAIAGKLSWDWAIKVIIGIVLIFGAASIVDYVISAST